MFFLSSSDRLSSCSSQADLPSAHSPFRHTRDSSPSANRPTYRKSSSLTDHSGKKPAKKTLKKKKTSSSAGRADWRYKDKNHQRDDVRTSAKESEVTSLAARGSASGTRTQWGVSAGSERETKDCAWVEKELGKVQREKQRLERERAKYIEREQK